MTKAFKKALAKGLSRAAARNVTIAYGVAHLATAAASAAVLAEVVPPILSAAGLDEAEVRAGLALFRAVLTIIGARSLGKGSRKSRISEAEDKSAKGSLKILPANRGRAAEAGRPYPHKQVYIVRPDGKGYWIPSPTDPDDGVEVKKVSSGFAKWKFTATADANVLNWAAEQTCFDQDMETWKQNVTGTVNMKTRAVTYTFGGSK